MNKAGLYSTLIFHLSLLIILLIASIGGVVSKENTFVLDFTKQEEREKEIEVEQMKQMVSEEVDNLIAMARSSAGQPVRNVAVNANERLKDDRNANPAKVYDDARELQRKLDAAAQRSKQLDAADAANYAQLDANDTKQDKNDAPAYSGPSVLSYDLEGRTGTSLPVPAYKGYGGGDVSVKIYVNRSGRVIKAEVVEGPSSTDASLRNYAVAAAKKSRFSASTTAPDPQIGSIVYRFVRQ